MQYIEKKRKKRLSEAGEYDKIATIYQRKDTFKKKLLNADLYFTYPEIKDVFKIFDQYGLKYTEAEIKTKSNNHLPIWPQ